MKSNNVFSAGGLILLCVTINLHAAAAQKLSDPYQIMKNYFHAIGGLNRVKAEKSLYYEGFYFSGGVKGTIKQWYRFPDRLRQEVNFMGLNHIRGCNGKHDWEVDRNGKIKIEKSEEAIKRIRVSISMYALDYMNPDSGNFSLSLQGLSKVGNADCYVVKIANAINKDIYRYYINTDTYLPEKLIVFKSDEDVYTRYLDYRVVHGIRRPLRREITALPSGGKYVLQITKFIVDTPFDSSVFEPPQTDVQDFQFANGESAEDIPFHFSRDQIFVTARINGSPKTWLVDSGANATIIDLEYAKELGLKTIGRFKGHGIHSVFYYSYVRGPAIKLPGLIMDKQVIMVLDLKSHLTGILGYDFLSRFVTRIDYKKKRISFYHPDKFKYSGNGKVQNAPLQGKDFTISATVDGKYSGRWRIDSGAAFTAFHYPFAAENNLEKRQGEYKITYGIGGISKLRLVNFKKMELAGFEILKPLIAVPIQPTGGTIVQRSLIGNIGNSILSRFVLYLDYKNQVIIFEPYKDFK
jgi:hypothetical protein